MYEDIRWGRLTHTSRYLASHPPRTSLTLRAKGLHHAERRDFAKGMKGNRTGGQSGRVSARVGRRGAHARHRIEEDTTAARA